jgi:type IV secretion system protein TrbL
MFAAVPGIAALSNIAATGLPFVQSAATALPTYLTAAAQSAAPWAMPFVQPGAAAAVTGGAAEVGAVGAASTAAGGAATGGGAAAGGGALASLGPVAAVIGSGIAGLAAGTGLAMGVDEYGKGGMFGENEWGQKRSAFDWASDQGHGVSDFLGGGTLGDVGGAVTAGALSIPAALYGGVAQTAANGVSSLFDYFSE